MLVVALQLFNLSIYAQDFKPINCTECGGEVNISETIVEYVVEVVLGYTNAIPEQTQHHKDLHSHKHDSFKVIQFPAFTIPAVQSQCSARAVALCDSYDYLYLNEINPPPPKA